jgi:hypothetical protein
VEDDRVLGVKAGGYETDQVGFRLIGVKD